MVISKEAAVKAIGCPAPEDMALINALARRELETGEVYTFAVRLCDNDVDRDWERFDDQTLEELGRLFLGVSGVFDHQWSARGQTARIYRTQVVEEPGVLTADARPCRYLKGWAYMMRTAENADLIAEIDGGIKREVSVGCAVERVICSVCGEELDRCPHEKGGEYDGQRCCGILTGATDAYEWSFVAVPAQRKAGVIKSAGKQLEREARLGREYLSGLRRELVRLARVARPEAERALLEKAVQRLDKDELLGLIRAYRDCAQQRLGDGPQLPYGQPHGDEERAHSAFLI